MCDTLLLTVFHVLWEAMSKPKLFNVNKKICESRVCKSKLYSCKNEILIMQRKCTWPRSLLMAIRKQLGRADDHWKDVIMLIGNISYQGIYLIISHQIRADT